MHQAPWLLVFTLTEITTTELLEGFLHRIEGIGFAGKYCKANGLMELLWQGFARVRIYFVEFPVDINPAGRHTVKGKGAGFIHAQNRSGAQSLDGRYAPSQHPPLGHSPGS